MERLELEVAIREETGKGSNRRLRARGFVPAIVYGGGGDTVPLEVEQRPLERLLRRGSNQLIDLKGPRKFKNRLVLLKDVQRDPVSFRLVHCDFYQVDTKKRVHVSVRLRLEGKPHGVEMGGVLEPLLREIEISCLPLAIPDHLSLDISGLEIGDSIRVSALELPEDVELLTDPSMSVVHVIAPRVEEEEAPEVEEAAEVEAAEPTEEAAAPAAPEEDSGE